MYLEIGNFLPDCYCPKCNIGLDILTSYEDSEYNINDTKFCPNCDTSITVTTNTKIIYNVVINNE